MDAKSASQFAAKVLIDAHNRWFMAALFGPPPPMRPSRIHAMTMKQVIAWRRYRKQYALYEVEMAEWQKEHPLPEVGDTVHIPRLGSLTDG